jgi:carbon-monoxide dehydrogenase large subunit
MHGMRELVPLLRGEARYVADLVVAGALHACFVRSEVAHARVRVDAGAARVRPGVVAVFVAGDLEVRPALGFEWVPPAMARPALAGDVVRFVGEPVALVVAETLTQAVDAAEAVVVHTEPLPPLVDPVAAAADGATLLFPEAGSNEAFRSRVGIGHDDALADAEVVVRSTFLQPRLSASPMETSGIVVVPGEDGRLTLHASTQGPHAVRDAVAHALGMAPADVRVVAPHVGGAFGAKYHVCPEYLPVAAAARALGRPVRWIETRREHLIGPSHGRGQVQEVALGLRRDGTVAGLSVRLIGDGGAYPGLGAVMPNATAVMACGPYRIPKVAVDARGVVTTTAPTIAYRGAGRPEAAYLLERSIDRAARTLGLDPVALRRRNLLTPDQFPYATPTGLTYDSGDHGRTLDRALELIGYDAVRAEQARRRDAHDGGPLLGVGVAVYLDVTPFRLVTEYAALELRAGTPDGEPVLTLTVGSCSHGQQHETTYGALIERVLGLGADRLVLRDRDTDVVPRGMGSASARSVQIAGSAVHEVSLVVLDEARRRAAERLEARVDDVEVVDGGLGVRGVPARAVSWVDLVRDAPIRAELDFTQAGSTIPSGVHAAVVEIDRDTGAVTLVRFVAVDDCGVAVVPRLVEGQQRGGATQGIAAALFEHAGYDLDGTPRAASLADYLVPSAADVPPMVVDRTETPTPLNPIGAKGIGQSGAIGAPAAVANAVHDALAPLGVGEIDLPFTPERVWQAIRDAVPSTGPRLS